MRSWSATRYLSSPTKDKNQNCASWITSKVMDHIKKNHPDLKYGQKSADRNSTNVDKNMPVMFSSVFFSRWASSLKFDTYVLNPIDMCKSKMAVWYVYDNQ